MRTCHWRLPFVAGSLAIAGSPSWLESPSGASSPPRPLSAIVRRKELRVRLRAPAEGSGTAPQRMQRPTLRRGGRRACTPANCRSLASSRSGQAKLLDPAAEPLGALAAYAAWRERKDDRSFAFARPFAQLNDSAQSCGVGGTAGEPVRHCSGSRPSSWCTKLSASSSPDAYAAAAIAITSSGSSTREPGGAVLGGDDVEAERLAEALAVDADGVADADVDGSAALAALDDQRVEGEVGVGGAIERAGAVVLDDLIERLGQPRDLAPCSSARRRAAAPASPRAASRRRRGTHRR
jgi:hypothetical protein